MKDDELASGQGVRQWLIECRLYSIQKALYIIPTANAVAAVVEKVR
jgi:hypothetical protein